MDALCAKLEAECQPTMSILIVTVWNQILESLFLNEHTHTLMIL